MFAKMMGLDKDDYIEMISLLSDQYGNELIKMMERYNKPNLREITYEEAIEYYGKLKERLFYV